MVGFFINGLYRDLPFERIGTTSENEVHVRLTAVNNHIRAHASHALKSIRLSSQYVRKVAEFEKYKGGNYTYYILEKDENGMPIIIEDSGLLGLRAYRQFNENIQIDYIFSKEITIEHWPIFDSYILNLMDSFRRPCSS